MKKLCLNLAGCVAIPVLLTGCVRVYGTIRVVQGEEPQAAESAAVSASTKAAKTEAPAEKPAQPAKKADIAKPKETPEAKPEKPAKEERAAIAEKPAEKPAEPPAKKEKPAKTASASGGSLTLPVTRDTKFTHHSSELAYNNGKSNRLRLVTIEKKSAELVTLDFDRNALKSFVESHAGKTLEGKLVLSVREIMGDAAKVEVCAFDSAVDWNEGASDRKKAVDGESCAAEAQAGKSKWKTPDGKEVESFRELIYRDDTIQTLVNSQGVEITAGKDQVEIPMDDALIRHLGTDPNCRGLVLFIRSGETKVDFFSRDQNGKEMKLVVSAK